MKQFHCRKCGKEFGPNMAPWDDNYEQDWAGLTVIYRYTMMRDADSIMLCPECGEELWKTAKEMIKEEKE